MADIINLRRARKAKKRQAASDEADANRIKFGRTKGEKVAGKIEERHAAKKLDQSKLDPKG